MPDTPDFNATELALLDDVWTERPWESTDEDEEDDDPDAPEDVEAFAESPIRTFRSIHGLTVAIEHPAGSTRTGTSATGHEWSQEMHCDYGRLPRTEGADGEAFDVFLGPDATAQHAFVIDQHTPDGKRFDEHKLMLGWPTFGDAVLGYVGHYPPGWKGLGAVTPLPASELPGWLHTHNPAVPAGPIKVNVPDYRQRAGWDCGADCLKCVLEFFGENVSEEAVIAEAQTNPKDGTPPERLIEEAHYRGLSTHAAQGLTIDDLKNFLDEGMPVICCIQEGSPEWNAREENGHWVVVIGHDAGGLWLQDPLTGRRRVSYGDWEENWHDRATDGTRYEHYGIALWKEHGQR